MRRLGRDILVFLASGALFTWPLSSLGLPTWASFVVSGIGGVLIEHAAALVAADIDFNEPVHPAYLSFHKHAGTLPRAFTKDGRVRICFAHCSPKNVVRVPLSKRIAARWAWRRSHQR